MPNGLVGNDDGATLAVDDDAAPVDVVTVGEEFLCDGEGKRD